jgi:hypothetical protein
MNVLKLGVHFSQIDTNSYIYVKFYSAKNNMPDTLFYKKSFYFSDTLSEGWNFLQLENDFIIPPNGVYMVICNIQPLDRERMKEATKVSVLWYRFNKQPLLYKRNNNWKNLLPYESQRLKYHIKYNYK